MTIWRFIPFILSVSVTFASVYPATAEDATAQKEPAAKKRVRLESELDAYYSSIGLYINLTDAPIPDAGEKPELQIYRDLLFSSLIPRFLVLEASVFPMPAAGVLIKDHANDIYDDAAVAKNLNIVKAVTAGFDEPYALTAFLGNVVSFTRPGEKKQDGNFGYMGYLVSVGNYTIKDNALIRDKWTEIEWKIKGDRKFSTHSLHWSFRVGGKIHDNPFIKDVVYLSMRRSRLDFEDSHASFINNSGFEYTIDMDSQTFTPIRHYFVVDKKWPLKEEKMGFSFAVGFVWEGANKYTGELADKDKRKKWQLLLRPNIIF